MKKRAISLLLAIIMIVSFVLPTQQVQAVSSKDGDTYTTEKEMSKKETSKKETSKKETNLVTNIKHGTTMFEELQYKEPDVEASMKELKAIQGMLKNAKSITDGREIISRFDALEDNMYEMRTMLTLMNVYAYNDVTNEEYATKKNELTLKVMEFQTTLMDVAVAILDSKIGEVAKEVWTEEDIEIIRENASLMNESVIALTEKENLLLNDYYLAMNSFAIDVKGVTMTADEIAVSDKLTTEEKETYTTLYEKKLNEKVGNIYLDLVKVRKKISTSLGLDSYIEYSYRSLNRDYTAKDSKNLHSYIKKYIVPMFYEVASAISQEEVGMLSTTEVDMKKTFPVIRNFLRDMSGDALKGFNYMVNHNLINYDFSNTKANISYTVYLPSFVQPYVSLSRSGLAFDISTCVHEFGHFYSYYKHGNELATNLDLMEIHSQGLELLFMPYYKDFLDSKGAIAVQKYQLLVYLQTLMQGCMEDEFQQYVYSHNINTVQELNQVYYKIACEYGLADLNAETKEVMNWMYITHTFEMPFYYISYATSLVPALEIFKTSVSDWEEGVKQYLDLLECGTEEGFLTTLQESKINSPFEEETIKNISVVIREYLDEIKEDQKDNQKEKQVKPAA